MWRQEGVGVVVIRARAAAAIWRVEGRDRGALEARSEARWRRQR